MSKNLRVFHLICRKGIGGVQTQFETFYENLDTDQLDASTVIEPCTRKGVLGYFTLLRQLLVLFFVCRKMTTVIHVYNGLTSFRYLLLFIFLRPVNLIHHERGNAWNLPKGRDWLLRKNASFARLVLCNSLATKTLLIKRFHIDSHKLIVLYNGVHSSSQIRSLKMKSPLTFGCVFEIGFVGRLEPHKGVHILLDAIALYPKDQVRLTVIGDGSQRDFLEARALKLGINATFTGRLDHPMEEMNNFDCVVVPSIREPLGNVIIEAGILGKAVIATMVDGIPEIIEHEKSGILLAPDEEIPFDCFGFKIPIPSLVVNGETGEVLPPKQLSSHKLSEAILSLKDNPGYCVKLGTNLQAVVLRKFSVESYIDQLFKIYKKVTRVA